MIGVYLWFCPYDRRGQQLGRHPQNRKEWVTRYTHKQTSHIARSSQPARCETFMLHTIIGLVVCALGTLITGINFYTSWAQYPLHIWRAGSREDFHGDSGFPIVGSLLLWFGALLLVQVPVLMWTAFAISLLDTGGLFGAAALLWMLLFRSPRRET